MPEQLTNLLVPPWLQYPDMPRDPLPEPNSADRRYWFSWRAWYAGLGDKEQLAYQAIYPAPKNWPRIYEHAHMW